jgi:stage III sporulation protein AG
MEFKQKAGNFIKKLKTVKHIEIIIGVIVVCIIVLIYSGVSASNRSNTANASTGNNTSITSNSGSNGITRGLEDRLAEILSQIGGAGRVNVLITYSSSPELIPASTTNSHISTSGSSQTTTKTESPIIVNNEMIILREIMPDITGVIVVAEGASNPRVRLELLRATQVVLGVGLANIEIFAM